MKALMVRPCRKNASRQNLTQYAINPRFEVTETKAEQDYTG